MGQERKEILTPNQYLFAVSRLSQEIKKEYEPREGKTKDCPGIWAEGYWASFGVGENGGLLINSAHDTFPLLAVSLQGTRSQISKLIDEPILVTLYGDWLKEGGQRCFYYTFDAETGLMKFRPFPEQKSTQFHLALNGLPERFDFHRLLQKIPTPEETVERHKIHQEAILNSTHFIELLQDSDLLWRRVPDERNQGQFTMSLAIREEMITLSVPAIKALLGIPESGIKKYVEYCLGEKMPIVTTRCGERGLCQVQIHPEVKVEKMTRWKRREHPGEDLLGQIIPEDKHHESILINTAATEPADNFPAGKGEKIEVELKLFDGRPAKATIQFIPSLTN